MKIFIPSFDYKSTKKARAGARAVFSSKAEKRAGLPASFSRRARTLECVRAFAELLNHFAAECGDVVRFAAGDQSVIRDYFLILPFGAGIHEVGLKRRP